MCLADAKERPSRCVLHKEVQLLENWVGTVGWNLEPLWAPEISLPLSSLEVLPAVDLTLPGQSIFPFESSLSGSEGCALHNLETSHLPVRQFL